MSKILTKSRGKLIIYGVKFLFNFPFFILREVNSRNLCRAKKQRKSSEKAAKMQQKCSKNAAKKDDKIYLIFQHEPPDFASL